MGLFSHGDDDFAAAHADAGERKMKRRIARLEGLLKRTLSDSDDSMDLALKRDILLALTQTHYDEKV